MICIEAGESAGRNLRISRAADCRPDGKDRSRPGTYDRAVLFMNRFMRRIWAGIAVLVCAGALAACGSDDEDSPTGSTSSVATSAPTVPVPTATTSPTPTAPAPKPPKAPPAPLPVNGKNAKVPDVVGKTLQEATAALRQAGLVLDAEAKSGDRADIESSWEVCQTVPGPGKRTSAGTPVAVISAPPGQC
jgi:PASTA domain-containing protein